MGSASRCWAQHVSPCGQGISREHFVSRCIFLTEFVDVEGHPSGKEHLHIDDLVVKVLCKSHNEQLSELDHALADFVNVSRELDRLEQVRGTRRGARNWPAEHFVLDGRKIERCALKTILNCARVLKRELEGWTPPAWLAEVVFGTRSLDPGCGLGLIVRVGDAFRSAESTSIHFGTAESDDQIRCACLGLHGKWRLLCTWDRPLAELGQLNIAGGTYSSAADVLHHPKRAALSDRRLGLSVGFDWSGRWKADSNRNVVRLRTRYRAPAR